MNTADEARDLLVNLGAPPSLVTHTRLVEEAAEVILSHLQRLRVPHDADFVRIGVVIHDAGKIIHPHELHRGGAEHEAAGEKLLLAHGVDPALARCCRSHAQWANMPCSLEELLVALADTLWKGKRDDDLEKRVTEGTAERVEKGFWDLFVDLDTCFKSAAADGTRRLLQSQANERAGPGEDP